MPVLAQVTAENAAPTSSRQAATSATVMSQVVMSAALAPEQSMVLVAESH